jgi:hypothetical protein
MSMVAIGVTSATLAATSIGMAAAGVGSPTQPNLAASSREMANTNAALLPIQRGMEAAAQSGGDFVFSLPPGVKASDYGFDKLPGTDGTVQQVYVPNVMPGTGKFSYSAHNPNPNANNSNPDPFANGGKWVTYNAADFVEGGKYAGLDASKTRQVSKTGNGQYKVSFKGYGKADVEGAIAKEHAANDLKLAQKYDPQYIAEALRQQKEADPEAFAAREKMSQLIQDQIQRPLNSPVSDMINGQVQDSLTAAGDHRLTDIDQSRLNAAVASAQTDRGGAGPTADFSQPLTTGFNGEQRQQAATQAAMGFLSSGSSPEDIAYRREQQNLSNLSAEINGKTPQSQFSAMSGAQNGPTPMVTAPSLAVMPNNEAGARSVAIQNSNTANSAAANQANPWMSGLSSLINVGATAGKLGWKPFGA